MNWRYALQWVGGTLAVSLLLVIWLVLSYSDTTEFLLYWARYTARVGFVLFFCTFVASSLLRFWRNQYTRWLMRQRRYIGIAFAVSHTIHLAALTAFLMYIGEMVDIVTIVVGGLAYLFVWAMAFTSHDAAIKRLGARKWKILHTVGTYMLAFVFIYTYWGRVLEGEDHEFAIVATGLMLLAYGARFARDLLPSRNPSATQ